ncbi:response regulator transcription factor [Micrococcus porci]|uniref:response regulator transcription factor n=1 Tax=Micrococcus porci TaxID=2856555 RepID=UPI003CEFDE46
MARLLMLTRAASAVEVLPALDLLTHDVERADPRAALAAGREDVDGVLLDATSGLAEARTLARDLASLAPEVPVVAVMAEGALTAVGPEWSLADIVLTGAGPAEVDARVRLLRPADAPVAGGAAERLAVGGVEIDPVGYRARLDGRALNLTFREFELLKHLAQSPGRAFSREQLLQEVWGDDYFGGTRTVDVHVRRLRAKLGPDREQMIGTVRNVGYRFTPRPDGDDDA